MRNKFGLLNILIILFIVILFSFSLPAFSVWSKYPSAINQNILSYSPLNEYVHPLIPTVSTTIKPVVGAFSYILIDNKTNKVLLSHNENSKIYPASITKLATALTALNIYPLEEVITVDEPYTEGKIMELKLGESLTVKSLVTALLVFSANDAAFNLANHHSQGTGGFIKEMNLLSTKYGLKNTNFVNYDGIHAVDHYSTVSDLAQLGRIAIKNPIIKETVKNKNIIVSDISGVYIHDLTSTNELLGIVPEIEGLKTGWTPEAGGCFVSLLNLNGHELLSVVAQSPDRFADTNKILEWAKTNITWQTYQP